MSDQAAAILNAVKVKGGLIVHLGCGNGRLTASLRVNSSYLVHGLDTSSERVAQARKYVQKAGLYGPVSVDLFNGKHLPYADSLVNLLVVSGTDGRVSREEIARVLCPGGVALTVNPKSEIRNPKWVRPWPEDIDEWTHFLHGPDNNAVAEDTVVGPPSRVQWVAGPMWGRNHEFSPSVYGCVSAAGRIFYAEDEGPTGFVDPRLPERMSLVARDAFNGVLLWRRPLKSWLSSVRDWRRVPVNLQRRFVAVDDVLYVTLGVDEPVSAIDAATGEVIRAYEGTERAAEIICVDGVLVAAVSPVVGAGQGQFPGRVVAVDGTSAQKLWEVPGAPAALSLSAAKGKVFSVLGKEVLCLALRSGKELWRTRGLPVSPKTTPLIAQDDFVLVLGKWLTALSTESGEARWEWKANPRALGAFVSPRQAFVIDGLVWPGISGLGLDPATGQQKRKIRIGMTGGHHHRCYLRKATSRYLMGSKRGIEFYDVSGKNNALLYNWVRGTCRLGFIPCNGLIYSPPNACRCYIEAQMHGFHALASVRGSGDQEPKGEAATRLERGPAYQAGPQSTIHNPQSVGWPTYRHDAKRSGSTKAQVPRRLVELWRTRVAEKLTPPVMANGRIYLAAPESYGVLCLDARDGRLLWRFTAGGRVDTPPTYCRGSLLFGSADGWVYAVEASSGKLRWRFRCAPSVRRIGAFGRLESPWPVAGSVLVRNGIAYAAAGRSSLVDGGIWIYALDAMTGKVLHKTRVADEKDAAKAGRVNAFTMPGVQSDVLVAGDESIYMRQVRFNSSLERGEDTFIPTGHLAYVRRTGLRLYASSGLTDGSLNNRAYWLMGANYGNLLVFDDAATYGVKMYRKRSRPKDRTLWSLRFTPASEGYQLYSAPNRAMEGEIRETGRSKRINGPGAFFVGLNETHTWERYVPVRVKAMVATADALLIAGPPDVIDDKDPLGAFEGRKGALLKVLSKRDGKEVSELKRDSPPVFDGMIAADGKVVISTEDGAVVCLGTEAK